MYQKIASVMSKPAFINVMKTFHKLLNSNENYADKDEIVKRIHYIATTLSTVPITDLIDTTTLDPETVKDAQMTLDMLKDTAEAPPVNFVSLFTFVTKNFKRLNVCAATLVESNTTLTLHDTCTQFISNAIPVLAVYE